MFYKHFKLVMHMYKFIFMKKSKMIRGKPILQYRGIGNSSQFYQSRHLFSPPCTVKKQVIFWKDRQIIVDITNANVSIVEYSVIKHSNLYNHIECLSLKKS